MNEVYPSCCPREGIYLFIKPLHSGIFINFHSKTVTFDMWVNNNPGEEVKSISMTIKFYFEFYLLISFEYFI